MSLLEIRDLQVQYITKREVVRAVNSVSLTIDSGETVGLVGETGAGKTTTALSLVRLVPEPPGKITGGQILYDGQDLMTLSERELRRIRGRRISMIFQDPMTALNPIEKVGDQIAEVIREHTECSDAEAMQEAMRMLEKVGIPAERAAEYPHQFSGGMKQRVVIAIALACNPEFLIADEPTTALDVTIQAQVLAMMKQLQKEYNTAMLLITHDLGVVSEICDKVAIMYAGEIVEFGTLEQIFDDPRHPYTQGLFGAIPTLDKKVRRLEPIEGLMPDPSNLPEGCCFQDRCKLAGMECEASHPAIVEVEPGHWVRCVRGGKADG